MVRGHMCVGVTQDKLMVRTGPEEHAHTLTLKHAVPMDFTGKPLKGFVFVPPPGCATQRAVDAWVKRALAFVASLPARKKLAEEPYLPATDEVAPPSLALYSDRLALVLREPS